MATGNDRRNFLNALGAGASGILLASAAGDSQAADEPGNGQVFKGTSKKGDIKEALDAAIQAAMATARGNDRQVRWTFKSLSGVNGGIIGAHEVTVTIEAAIL
ncbi:hypothetical protein [Singulisphaera acidiphila]|uniref:Uncharacterized protein n=1 Tax=Singulisphaera acidiphila (strain ATCC BAA-1392 / DSM 18658 / VKM B-2454 / MOB10) TaxID=886293 RepID=L0DHC0_SINAD|nr:hypothetical protein [Singulisphaera acidiphila]AGA28657.1 hypothetical protein Sinac_4468 [Singulisphaera acidiphila DSM 18658]